MIKEIRDIETNELTGYQYNGMTIPLDPNNRHYQEIQELIANGESVEPAFSLDELKQFKVNELKSFYEHNNQEDVIYMDTTFQADKKSQDLIVSVLSAGSVPDGFFWLDAYNNQVPMTYRELQGLSSTILKRNQENFVKLQLLKTKVKNALTKDDLSTIVW